MSEFDAIKALLLQGYAVTMNGRIEIRPTDQGVIRVAVDTEPAHSPLGILEEQEFPNAGINDAILSFLKQRKERKIGPEFE